MKKNLICFSVGIIVSLLLFWMGFFTLTLFKISDDTAVIAIVGIAILSILGSALLFLNKSTRDYILKLKNWITISRYGFIWFAFMISIKLWLRHYHF